MNKQDLVREGTRSIMKMMIRSLRKRGVKVKKIDLPRLRTKEFSGVWAYLQELDRNAPKKETEQEGT